MGRMEIRAYAAAVIEARTLDGKLAPAPAYLTDIEPGAALRYAEPVRPPGLEMVHGASPKVPPPAGMCDPAQRRRIVHAMANHELQAVELFAWALLAFPDAPNSFRAGLLKILGDEQRHCGLYLDRLTAMGGALGEHPVSGLFWRRAAELDSPLAFVCTMGLTFESANLDFALEPRVVEEIHDDEIAHVAFGWRWMREFKDKGRGDWETFVEAGPRHAAERARGATFDRAGRERAGLTAEFIDRLEATRPTAPGGKPRRR